MSGLIRSASPTAESPLEIYLQRQLQVARGVDLAAGSESHPVEHVKRFGAEFHPDRFVYRETSRKRHVFGKVREKPQLRVIAGRVADPAQGRAGSLIRERPVAS